ncbi:MAG: tryptophan synthase subunit alpha [Actinomycetota bacterium]
MTSRLALRLESVRSNGAKAFVPYVTAGLGSVDPAMLRDLQAAGADAVEVGIPFSDPVMDGPVIQEASRRALEAGATVDSALRMIADAELDVPVALMTYVNPVLAYGEQAFVDAVAAVGVSAVIVPDLPVDEAGSWIGRCRSAEVGTVFLAAPNSTTERLRQIAGASDGFVYCVSTFGVTGRRDELAGSARSVVEALRPVTETPLLVGVGVSTPAQAAEACSFADGVIVGTALVMPLLDGDRDAMLDSARAFRDACHG